MLLQVIHVCAAVVKYGVKQDSQPTNDHVISELSWKKGNFHDGCKRSARGP